MGIISASLLIFGYTTEWEDYTTVLGAGIGVLGSVVGAVLGASLSASLMVKLFGAGMSWYSREFSSFVLYGPPAVAGALTAQYLLTSRTSPTSTPKFEYATFQAIHLFFVLTALIFQSFGLGSACVFTISSIGSLASLVLNAVLNAVEPNAYGWDVNLVSYVVAQVVPLVVGTELTVGLMTIFVPLTGRMGEVSEISVHVTFPHPFYQVN